MTLKEDKADIERVAVSRQDVPDIEREAMAATLGTMQSLDPSEDAERRPDAGRSIKAIGATLGRAR